MLKIGNTRWKRWFLRKYKLSKLTQEVHSKQFSNYTEINNVDNDFTGEQYQTFKRIFTLFKTLHGTEKKSSFTFHFLKPSIILTSKLQKIV